MGHTFEPAASGRSKCRGCGAVLQKGEIRFGERLENPFAAGELTHWFHPMCAAYKRPDAILAALEDEGNAPDRDALERSAKVTLEHRRLQRIDGVERSPGSQAKCRHCRNAIKKGSWRIRLVFHEEGMFSPGGYIHLTCREPYFETADILDQVLHFSRALDDVERTALRDEFGH